MIHSGRILGLIAAVAATLFVVLIVISFGWLRPEGISNFDARVFGYDLETAQTYLAVLPDAGRALYLGLFRWLDTVFPILAAIAIGGATWRNLSSRSVVRRVASMGMALAYLMLDLAENAFVAQMLRSDGPVTQALVDRASDMTQLKWLFMAVAIGLLLTSWYRKWGEAL